MRIDTSQQQYQCDEMKLVRLMHGLRVLAASIVIAGIGVIAVATAVDTGADQPRVAVQGTDLEYATGAAEQARPEAQATASL